MTRRWGRIVLAGLLLTASRAAAEELDWPGSGGWGCPSISPGAFDPNTVKTLEGEILAVQQREPSRGVSAGIHVALKVGGERFDVHLGPAWYVLRQDTKLVAHDRVAVTGSLRRFDHVSEFIAISVKRGDQVLVLRDERGHPNWAGCRNPGRREAATP